MAQDSDAPVVVAVNGSPGSDRALDWAADDARIRGRVLRVVYAFDWPVYHALPHGLPGFDVDEFARRIVDRARQRALERVPELTVDAVHITGDPTPILLLESQRAHSLVVGAHHMKALDAVLPDSRSLEVLASASCPVVVVPDLEPRPSTGRVMVGVDGSKSAHLAARWAFSTAEARGAVLLAVTAHKASSAHGLGALRKAGHASAGGSGEAAQEALRTLSDSIASERDRLPRVRVEEVVKEGHPVEVLCSVARDCDLMVVGSHGRGGFAGMLLGSVSRNVIAHSPCPVAVVRTPGH